MHGAAVYLIGQVGREVVGAGVIEVAGESHITVAKEDHVRCGAGDQEVRANVKFLPFQQQWALNVAEGTMTVSL